MSIPEDDILLTALRRLLDGAVTVEINDTKYEITHRKGIFNMERIPDQPWEDGEKRTVLYLAVRELILDELSGDYQGNGQISYVLNVNGTMYAFFCVEVSSQVPCGIFLRKEIMPNAKPGFYIMHETKEDAIVAATLDTSKTNKGFWGCRNCGQDPCVCSTPSVSENL